LLIFKTNILPSLGITKNQGEILKLIGSGYLVQRLGHLNDEKIIPSLYQLFMNAGFDFDT
jgi:hypothetical protein